MKVLDHKSNFLGLRGEDGALENSGVVVLPAPYERTSSYVQGSFKGPAAILAASSELEEFDEELSEEIYRLCGGIATLEPMLFATESGPDAVEKIRQTVQVLTDMGKFVVCLGGEHTCSLGPMRVSFEQYGAELSVLQLDAHGDLREAYQGNPYSHASVMARALEFVPSLVQLGIRAHSKEELSVMNTERVRTFYAQPIMRGQMTDWQDRVLDSLSDKVYLTIDSDFFDPALIPSVGTPEPGGFLWYEALEFLCRLCEDKTVVGFDLCEFSPVCGRHHPDFTLARLVYKLIGYVWKGRGGR